MKFDKYGCIEMEQCGWPGNIGDSCAETCRLKLLDGVILGLDVFKTDLGFVRHPTAPEGWRESDFSGDQALPLLMTGGGDSRIAFKNVGCFLVYFKAHNLLFVATLIQALLFKVPLRWDDGRKRFESGESSSADYLNFFMCMLFLHRRGSKLPLIKWLVPRERVEGKVAAYYLSEPNSAWVTKLYFKRISEVYF